MPIKINLHRTHRRFTDGREIVEVEGSTVGECIDHLTRLHPGIEEALFESPGRLRGSIEIYLNLESTYPDELARPTSDGDEIHITVMLAGG